MRISAIAWLSVSLVLGACGAEGDPDAPWSSESQAVRRAGPEVPDNLVPADGQRRWFVLGAEGSQIYVCQAGASGPAWTFREPEADLLNHRGRIVGSHYIGPTWEWRDGSTVVGRVLTRADAPVAGAIPWLLLEAVSHEGDGRFTQVTSIQRINTEGGVAPSEGCDEARLGAVAAVPYRADYVFFKARGGRGRDD